MTWGAGTLEVAGDALDYACFGPAPDAGAASPPTLVMLHEGLGSVGLWRDWPAVLAAATGWGVVAYSRAGYGRSGPAPLPWPRNYMTRHAEDRLGAVLTRLGVQRCVLLGHSDGASIAAHYAGAVSDRRVRGLVLIAPHFFVEASGVAAIRAARTAYETGDLKSRLARHHDDPDAAFYGWHDVWTHPAFADWSIADAIDHWRVPSLILHGDADPYGTLAQVREAEERSYAPVETSIFAGAGHAPHQDDPARATADVAAFCARLHALERSGAAPDQGCTIKHKMAP